jgi:aminoglycoside/choline kinase family phosphotransferase
MTRTLPAEVLDAASRALATPLEGLAVEKLEKGGSDRAFFRITGAADRSLIAVVYGDGREENRHYVAIGEFLAAAGLRVPKVLLHDEPDRLILMEDLGETDLWSFRLEPWATREPLYRSALDQAALLHATPPATWHPASHRFAPTFDARLYRWEQEYFARHCLQDLFGIDPAPLPRDGLESIADRLAAEPRTLVHRDFQSQNILIRDGAAHLIDFQGLRAGLPHYDVASLLLDPYAGLAPAEQEALLDAYLARAGHSRATFLPIYRLCALQRLMQALGAYGNLGLNLGRPHFLQYVAPALASLRSLLAQIEGLDPWRDLVDSLPDPPAR